MLGVSFGKEASGSCLHAISAYLESVLFPSFLQHHGIITCFHLPTQIDAGNTHTHTHLHTHKHASLIEKPFPLASVKEHIFISACLPTSYSLPQHYPRQRLCSAAPPSHLSLVATCLITSGKVLFLLMYKKKTSGKQGSEK